MMRDRCSSPECLLKCSLVANEYGMHHTTVYVICCDSSGAEIIEESEIQFPLKMVVCAGVVWKGMMVLSNLSVRSTSLITIVAQENASAHLSLFIIGSGSLECRISAQGDSSEVALHGAYSVQNADLLTITTAQHHTFQNSSSAVRFFGVLSDDSRVSYKGLITIGPDAAGTNASQQNKNIVLSNRAQVISISAIEVLHNEVQCTHGSAISYLEKEHLLYAQARGIAPQLAQPLLIESFLRGVFDDAESAAYFQKAINLVSQRLSFVS